MSTTTWFMSPKSLDHHDDKFNEFMEEHPLLQDVHEHGMSFDETGKVFFKLHLKLCKFEKILGAGHAQLLTSLLKISSCVRPALWIFSNLQNPVYELSYNKWTLAP